MKQKEIELPDETATLQLSQFYSYSEKLEVKDGQSVEVSTKETAKLLVLLLLLMIPVLQLGSSFPGNIPLLLGTLLVFFYRTPGLSNIPFTLTSSSPRKHLYRSNAK